MSKSLPPAYFNDLYDRDPDPWRFATSAYEADKYAATLAFLPRSRYRSALEVGCSIGVFTRQLAERCDSLLALDIAPAALAQARDRCRDLTHVRFENRSLPGQMPAGPFDLVMLSEVAYYWTAEDLALAIDRMTGQIETAGHLLLVHWRGDVPDYPLNGDQVHDMVASWADNRGLVSKKHHRETLYRLDLYEKN